jgi:hypothetical protein
MRRHPVSESWQMDPNLLLWLLRPDTPAVRHLALRDLLGRSSADPEVADARAAAMASDPIAAILAAQHPDGYWEKPGPGYATKYRGTVWQVILLDQLGADPTDERIQTACAYILAHSVASTGGFGASGRAGTAPPPPSAVIHCLNGNLLRALIGFGWLDDQRVQGAIDWEARAITGKGMELVCDWNVRCGFRLRRKREVGLRLGRHQSHARTCAHPPIEALTPRQ